VPVVLNISSTQVISRPNSPFSNDPFFRHFFGDDGDLYGPQRDVEQLGSGVVSADGFRAATTTSSRVSRAGSRCGNCPPSAWRSRTSVKRAQIVASIRSPNTPCWLDAGPADDAVGRFGEIEGGRVGMAIGNRSSSTRPSRSASCRRSAEPAWGSWLEDFIQTDAAISRQFGRRPDQRAGRLIGINTAIFARAAGIRASASRSPATWPAVVADFLKSAGGGVDRLCQYGR
jgi:serine protease DegS